MKKYVDGLLIIGIGVCLFTLMKQNKVMNKMKSNIKPTMDSLIVLKKQVDSLQSEIYVNHIEAERYEYIIDRAQAEMSPNCKEELETIMSQTE